MKNNNITSGKSSGKSLTALAVLAVSMFVLGIAALLFTFFYAYRFSESGSKSLQAEVPQKIPENATPLRKDTEINVSNYEQTADFPAAKLIDAPYINQTKKYPTGCESVSAVMALRFAGYSITPEDFIDNYLPKSPSPYINDSGELFGYNPYKYFIGDPYSSDGWGCYYTVIGRCLSRIINKSRHKVVNLHGASLPRLVSYIDKDIPVIIWATQGMSEPERSHTWSFVKSKKKFTWVTPNHCLLLVGYDDTGYYFNDPLTHKNCRYPADIVNKRYISMGRQALAIIPRTGAYPDIKKSKQ